MKTKLLFLIALMITVSGYSQIGFNYKALIKDNNGNVIANQDIDLKFTIQYDGGEFGIVTVYQESHTVTSDANGIIIANLGEGTVISGSFPQTNWITGNFLVTEIDIEQDGSFENMGTTNFKQVPMAIRAKRADIATTAITANNVTGLEALNEGNGIGYRIIGKNPSTAGAIGINAVDLSQSPINSETYGATGANSAALNRQTTAQGQNSTAMGLDSKAYGNTSTVMGFNTVANGYDAVAMGAYTVADAVQSVAIGRFNVGGGHNQIWNPIEPVFEIGNGTNNANRNNALTVLKNGTITAPSLTNSLINTAGNKSLLTKEYADAHYVPNETITKEIMIPSIAFQPNENYYPVDRPLAGGSDIPATSRYQNILGKFHSSSDIGHYSVPIILPVGAIINEISVYVDYNIKVYLTHYNVISDVYNNFATLTTNSGTENQVLTYSDPIYILSNYTYFLTISQPDGEYWNNQLIKGVKIVYTE